MLIFFNSIGYLNKIFLKNLFLLPGGIVPGVDLGDATYLYNLYTRQDTQFMLFKHVLNHTNHMNILPLKKTKTFLKDITTKNCILSQNLTHLFMVWYGNLPIYGMFIINIYVI